MSREHVLADVAAPARARGHDELAVSQVGHRGVSSSRQGTSSTSISSIRTFGIAAHHWAAMNVARWL